MKEFGLLFPRVLTIFTSDLVVCCEINWRASKQICEVKYFGTYIGDKLIKGRI